jgi:hypothetical protein
MDDIGLTSSKKYFISPKAVDQRSVISLGQFAPANVPAIANGITANLGFKVLKGNGGYPIILGHPSLEK